MRATWLHALCYCCCLLWAALNWRDAMCTAAVRERATAQRAARAEQQLHALQLQRAVWSVAVAVNRSRGHSVTQVQLTAEWRSLGVVLAFPPSQAQLVVQNLHSWSLPQFAPCERYSHNRTLTPLLFYMSRRDDAALAAVHDATARRHFPRHCFSRIEWRFANLSAADDVYGAGTLAMWYQLWGAPHALPPTNYLLWMEPDLRPVRALWLERLVQLVSLRLTRVWQLGSLPRYKENNDWHLNGNALYSADDAMFARFVLNSRDAFRDYLSFDKNLYEARRRDYAFSQRYDHMFQTTDVIQNRANEPLHLSQFLRQNPESYLVHGKGAVASLDKLMPKWMAEQEALGL